MNEQTFNLVLPEDISFPSLLIERAKGGRFVFFTYLIPRPWTPVKRVSKIYFVRPQDKISRLNKKYNLITLLWGWWGLPMGPAVTYATVKGNRTGIDVTDEVYENLTEEDFEQGKVVIRKVNNIFLSPTKSNFKELSKCSNNYHHKKANLSEEPVVGLYIDTKEPYYIIGLHKFDLEKAEYLKTELYQYFFKFTKFEFVDLEEKSEKVNKLKQQGKKITIAN